MSHAAAGLFTCSGPRARGHAGACLLGRLQDCSGGILVGGGHSKLPGAWENLRDSHPEEAKMRVSALPPILMCSKRHCWGCPLWRGAGSGREVTNASLTVRLLGLKTSLPLTTQITLDELHNLSVPQPACLHKMEVIQHHS